MNPASNGPGLKTSGARRVRARGLPATAACAIPCRPGALTGRGVRLARGQSHLSVARPFGMLSPGAVAANDQATGVNQKQGTQSTPPGGTLQTGRSSNKTGSNTQTVGETSTTTQTNAPQDGTPNSSTSIWSKVVSYLTSTWNGLASAFGGKRGP